MTTSPFDAAELLDSEEGVVAFLDAASEGWDCGHIADALEIVTRAKGFDALGLAPRLERKAA